MIKYVRFYKLREGVGDEEKQRIARYLDELPRRVGWVRSYTWGEALTHVGEEYDYAHTADFDDLAAMEGYLHHPERVAIEQFISGYAAKSAATYYEVATK